MRLTLMRGFLRAAVVAGLVSVPAQMALAQVVPGTGTRLDQVGDDFEDPEWGFTHNFPKGSKEQDEQTRPPQGFSSNSRWYEGPMRGQPDHLKRVETPEGGLEGSTGALLMQSLRSGVPQYASHKPQQDDLVANVGRRIGGQIMVSRTPSVVTRVYIPDPADWENRSGVSFGFRAGTYGRFFGNFQRTFSDKKKPKPKPGELEEYWPGMFIQLNPGKGDNPSTAQILVRSNNRGYDMNGPVIKEPGWWTLGMSFTPDGKIHYYASPGVDPLTTEDYITSSYPYSYRCERFSTFFFNVVNQDDGKTWSTPWIVDDSEVFVLR